MKIEELIKFNIIFTLSPTLVAKELEIKRDMVQKYKSGSSLIPLNNALVLKNKFNIELELWVELWTLAKRYSEEIKEYRRSLKNV